MIGPAAAAAAQSSYQWGPLIFGALVSFGVLILTALIAFAAWIVRKLEGLGLADVLNSKKAHDEIMDNKLAGAELNETVKGHERRLTALESYHENTLQPMRGNQ